MLEMHQEKRFAPIKKSCISVFFDFGKTYNTAPNNHGKTQNAEPAACNKTQKQEQNIKCLNFEKIKYRCRDLLKNLL